MSNKEVETHVVEFWPKPFKSVGDKEVPQLTTCVDAQSAVALEASFHAIGWPARAMTLQTRVERRHLTSSNQAAGKAVLAA